MRSSAAITLSNGSRARALAGPPQLLTALGVPCSTPPFRVHACDEVSDLVVGEQARVDHLLGQARALELARQIRTYVDAVRGANDTAPDPMSAEELEAWSAWALDQADRIRSGAFKCLQDATVGA